MRSRSGQQLLEWTSVRPSRVVGIDLTDNARDRAPTGAGRDAETPAREEVAGADRRADSRGPVRAPLGERRFRLEALSREQLMDEIIEHNGSATVAFLSEFDDTGLRRYLTRLRSTRLGRGRESVAERPAGTPAISAHKRRC